FKNDLALETAKKIDLKIKNKQAVGPLAGIPITIKDMICSKGHPTTAASKILQGFKAPYSATLVDRLEAAGAVIVGKCNQDEFAMGSSNEHSFYGAVKNPWNELYVAGGSSGGSAVTVAANMCWASIGTDTGGSIRQPAHFCGVVGVKPTYGRVSRYGVIAYGSSLDQAGPLARSVEDAALILEVISGRDEMDATSANIEVPKWSATTSKSVKGLTVGVPRQVFQLKLDPHVEKGLQTSLEILRKGGANIIELDMKMADVAVSVYYLIAASEASSNLSRYDGVRYGFRADFTHKSAEDLEDFYSRTRGDGFGSEVKRRILMGTYFLSSGYYDEYFSKACKVRRLIADEIKQFFSSCDVLVSPVATTSAFKIGEKLDDPLSMYMNDVLTVGANLAGVPSMSLPVNVSEKGLPSGLQITANMFAEDKMFQAASFLESELKFSMEKPK
ncbi:MAG: Asp-tRNA(Asn)/Glu-tRNA(Gln) amidotransferase subunit GatA, partial [Bdellovibrionales bacterium]|nr:Asp-tRNA(Asn)/Glu-tRNA(Gln) amidotransferase subunit GatA [Bdellovibrionales bacterium]